MGVSFGFKKHIIALHNCFRIPLKDNLTTFSASASYYPASTDLREDKEMRKLSKSSCLEECKSLTTRARAAAPTANKCICGGGTQKRAQQQVFVVSKTPTVGLRTLKVSEQDSH